MRIPCLMLLAAALSSACSQDPPVAPGTPAPDAAHRPRDAGAGGARSPLLPTDAALARVQREGPDAAFAAMRPFDYLLQYRMMERAGIVEALGGEANSIAALRALGDDYERQLRALAGDMPRLVPVAFTGDGIDSGFVGAGFGGAAGLLVGATALSGIGGLSDEQLAERTADGPFQLSKDGANTVTAGADGSMDMAIEFRGEVEQGLSGTMRTKIHVDGCPDPSGRVTVTMQVSSAMQVSGRPGVGGFVDSELRYERWLDDDAQLLDGIDGMAVDMRMHAGGRGARGSQFLDGQMAFDRGGTGDIDSFNQRGFDAIFHGDEIRHALEMAHGSLRMQMLLAEFLLRGLGSSGAPWESGHCIRLDVSSAPEKRSGLRPSTAFDLVAAPRVKADGSFPGGTVRATLAGGERLTRDLEKVRANAEYHYTAPAESRQSATIAFEARSKRGVGRATLAFDTRRRGYRLQGHYGKLPVSATTCSLEQPFDVALSIGLTMRFTPSGSEGGRWTLHGTAGGVPWSGGGGYALRLDDGGGGTLTSDGTATANSPVGAFSKPVPVRLTASAADDLGCD